MPTVLSHALVPAAIGLGLGQRLVPPRLLLAGALAAALPDADVVAFKFGIAYADGLGHRGASHSVLFALLCGALATLFRHRLRAPGIACFLFVAGSVLSHPLLDMLTNGGLGVALFWPISDHRWFAPWRVVEVSPFIHRFFSARGLAVLWSEARWLVLPSLLLGALLAAMRLWVQRSARTGGSSR